MSVKHTFFGTLVCLLLVAAGIVTSTKIPKLNPAKLIDLRKDTTRNQYAIMIIQREAGFYGHTFLSTSDYSRPDTFPKTLAYGFYALADDLVNIAKGKAVGKVLDDFEPIMYAGREVELNLIIWVDRDMYERCVAVIKRMEDQNISYALFNNDCVTLVQQIGKVVGLKLPSRLLNPLPRQYVEALFNIN